MKTYTYKAILPKQCDELTVFAFSAKASDVLGFAKIDRIGRERDGSLKGFQRPQVANHIKEIRTYLSKDDAVLPNSVVVAFTSGIRIGRRQPDGTAEVEISIDDSPLGFVVDGQQRLSALQGIPDKDFEVLVSGIACSNEEELRKQFILINNTRPLPKTLIYELLPTVAGLPHRLSCRAAAASLVERLNYDEGSSLNGQIKQHTNPTGVIQDTVMQKVIMNSLNDGVLRGLNGDDQFKYLSAFYSAVQTVFDEDWRGHKPRTSRLVHSAGILAMGFVMEYVYAACPSADQKRICELLKPLVGRCAWTKGNWVFGDDYIRPWNSLQFVPRDYLELSQYLLRELKQSSRATTP
ncbi:MAG: DGQHR domain-containing protein DpdB [Pseudomonadales bacterium]